MWWPHTQQGIAHCSANFCGAHPTASQCLVVPTDLVSHAGVLEVDHLIAVATRTNRVVLVKNGKQVGSIELEVGAGT